MLCLVDEDDGGTEGSTEEKAGRGRERRFRHASRACHRTHAVIKEESHVKPQVLQELKGKQTNEDIFTDGAELLRPDWPYPTA